MTPRRPHSLRPTATAAILVALVVAGSVLRTVHLPWTLENIPRIAGGSGPVSYYISTTGSDGNPCSLSQPCATLDHFSAASFGGAGILNPGDEVSFLSGVYQSPATSSVVGGFEQLRGVSGTAQDPITITTDATTPATLTIGLDSGSVTEAGEANSLLYLKADAYVTVDRLNVVGPRALPGYTTGHEPFGGEVWTQQGTGPLDAHLTFRHMTVLHATGSGCIKNQDELGHTSYISNTIVDCGELSTDHPIYETGPSALLSGNIISGTSGFGLQLRGVTGNDGTIENNIVHGAAMAGFTTDGSGMTIRGNVFYGNGIGCIQTTNPNNDTITGNVCYDNGQTSNAGAFLFFGNHDATNDLIAYNTVEDGPSCLNFQGQIQQLGVATAITIADNIISGPAGCFNTPLNTILTMTPTVSGGLWDYNAYVNVRPTYPADGGTTYDAGHGLAYDTDPLFVGGTIYPTGLAGDPGLPDFHLQVSSPACTAGVSLAGPPGPNPLTLGAYGCAAPTPTVTPTSAATATRTPTPTPTVAATPTGGTATPTATTPAAPGVVVITSARAHGSQTDTRARGGATSPRGHGGTTSTRH